MENFFGFENLVNLATLSGLEIVLGVDNLIFIAIVVQHLSPRARLKARVIGLSLALIFRVLMLFGASFMIGLTEPLFTIFSFPFAGRNLLLIAGGLFLLVKCFAEIKEMYHIEENHEKKPIAPSTKFIRIIIQIIFVDLIFSFDSIIVAIAMTNNIPVITLAFFIAMIIMLISSKPIGEFIYKYRNIKIIALAFIFLIGLILLLNGFDINIDKRYLYFSMLFSIIVESINISIDQKSKKINKVI